MKLCTFFSLCRALILLEHLEGQLWCHLIVHSAGSSFSPFGPVRALPAGTCCRSCPPASAGAHMVSSWVWRLENIVECGCWKATVSVSFSL